MKVSSCPGCASRDFTVAGNGGSSFEVIAGGRRFGQPEYTVRTCNQCGLFYKSDILDPEELTKYYDDVDFTKWDIGDLFPSEKAILNVLNRLRPGSRVLDYGCSDGRLLSHLGDHYQKFGLEINESAAGIARQKHITILSSEEILGAAVASFDAIVLSDIFEHLVNPTEVLRLLRERLSVRGLLFLFTGDGDAKACQRDIANFWYFRTPEHLCMLSRKHAEYLSQHLDLRLTDWMQMSHYDLGLTEIARQYVQDFAYWQFRGRSSSPLSSLLKVTPVLRRARNWPTPPPVTYTKDHVLAVFQSCN
jgi:SAM-dependent methyltransferase